MSVNTTKCLYRYRQFSTQTIEMLCCDELYLANPVTFNDPLDCQPVVEADSNKSTLQNILIALIESRVERETLISLKKIKLNGPEASSHAKKFSKKAALTEVRDLAYQSTNPDHGDQLKTECIFLKNEIQNELSKRYEHGVCCFASEYDKVIFRVRAALSGDAPHRSVRDLLVIRFLGDRGQHSAPTYDSVPDKRLHHFCNLRFGQYPYPQKFLELIPIDEPFLGAAA